MASEVQNLAAQSAKAPKGIQGKISTIAATVEEQPAIRAEIASSLRSAASSGRALEASTGRVSTMTEDTGKAIGTINNATQSLIRRLQAV
jgi:methyl-accepting chemotaxis protein